MTVQIPKQKPSKEIELLLSELDFGKVQTKVNAIFEQGRKEGFSDVEIGGWIRSRMKGVYSDRTIRNVLPDTAKYQEKVRSAEKTSANERPLLEIPTARVEPTNKSLPSPEVRTVEGIENDGDIVTDAQPLQQDSKATANQTTEFTAEPGELSQTQPRSHLQQQPEPSTSTDAHPMIAKPTAVISKEWEIWDIETEGREIKRLEKYDKGSLIIIIKKLHTERKNLAEELWQKEVTSVKEDLTLLKELETENAKLKQNILELDKLQDESTKLNTDIQKALKTENQELENENADLKKQVEAVKPFVELFSGLNPEEMESWLQFMKNALEREKELRK